jgi:hypothetical protein
MAAALPVLQADWPAPPGVHALTTRRHGAGIRRRRSRSSTWATGTRPMVIPRPT